MCSAKATWAGVKVEERGKVAAKRPWKDPEEAVRPAETVGAVDVNIARRAVSSAHKKAAKGSKGLTIQLERQHSRVEEDVGTPGTLVRALEAKEIGSVPHFVGKLEEEGGIWWVLVAVGLEDLVRVGLDGVHEQVCEARRGTGQRGPEWGRGGATKPTLCSPDLTGGDWCSVEVRALEPGLKVIGVRTANDLLVVWVCSPVKASARRKVKSARKHSLSSIRRVKAPRPLADPLSSILPSIPWV